MKTTLAVIGIIIAFILCTLLLKVVFFPVHVANKAADTAYDVVDKTLNADNALFNYEQFHDQYEGAKQQLANIQNMDQQIVELKSEYQGVKLMDWDKQGKERLAFLQDTRNGYLMNYNRIKAEYDSNAKKLNRNLFKDRDLPYEIPPLN